MTKTQSKNYTLGIVGARGYVASELLALIKHHPSITVDWVSSRQHSNQPVEILSDYHKEVFFELLSPQQIADKNTDIIVLALPNGLSKPYIESIQKNSSAKVIIDLSVDNRFNPNWLYSIPELNNIMQGHNALSSPIKISNPGCYATAMQLALAPIKDLLNGAANCFGVSGYSGAGTKPCDNNNPNYLKNNLIGYSLVEHLHEKEVHQKLQHPVHFTPHVAEFFRGINMTIQVEFKQAQTSQQLFNRTNDFYSMQPLVNCQMETPTIQQVINTNGCIIGGFKVAKNGKRGTIVACLDNLLKGAASQALQNINLALSIEPTTGLQNSTPHNNFSNLKANSISCSGE